jgi:GNAT superfamily N-acetyltransferase
VPADAPALARVMRASIRALARGAYPARQLARWSSLPALYHAWAMTAGGEARFVAERGGRLVGFAALRGDEATALFVRPSAAGAGVGSALLVRLEREAARRGTRRLRLDASLNAAAFYRARGYRGARRVRVPLPGGGALAALRLAKPIASAPGR